LHVPYHDQKYVKLVSKIIATLQPNGGLVQLGDAVDFFQLSRFDKDPARKNSARDDLEEYREIMIKWAAALPRGATYHQICGNHEHRIVRYLWGNAPALHAMVKAIPDMLGFTELNKTHKCKFVWHPYERWQSCVIGDTLLTHGFYYSTHTAATMLAKYRRKMVQGHTHRLMIVHQENIWCATLGHASDESQTAHTPCPTGWTQAIGILTENDGECSIEIIPVENGSCVLRGKVISQ
jgi:hypothetical protein